MFIASSSSCWQAFSIAYSLCMASADRDAGFREGAEGAGSTHPTCSVAEVPILTPLAWQDLRKEMSGEMEAENDAARGEALRHWAVSHVEVLETASMRTWQFHADGSSDAGCITEEISAFAVGQVNLSGRAPKRCLSLSA